MPQIYAPLTPEVKLSAYYRGSDKALHQLDAWVTTDPEGVTEEDVARLQRDVMAHFSIQREVFIEPVMILIRGGKA